MSGAMTQEESEKWESFCREVGRFLMMFTRVEAHLITTARILTNAPPQFIRDLSGSWRVDVATKSIRNLLDTIQLPADLKNDLTKALEQLSGINSFRNGLLHSPTSRVPDAQLAAFLGKPPEYNFGGDYVAANLLHARVDGNIRVFPLSEVILRGVHDDLILILKYLHSCENRILDMRFPAERPVPPNAQAELEALRSKTWSWKAPQQGWKFAKMPLPA